MIGPTERKYPLSQATRLAPRLRRGRTVHVSTLFRWTTRGCRGVVLESIQCGGTRCTSVEALHRFYNRLTQASGTGEAPSVLRTTTQRQRQSEAAAKELDRLGC